MRTGPFIGVLLLCFGTVGCSGSKDNVTVTGEDGTKVTGSKDGGIKVDGPDGKASMGGGTSVTEAELGLPFYPGSVEVPGKSFKFEGKGEKDYMSVRTTTDDTQKVVDFYKEKVKGSTAGGGAGIMLITGLLEDGSKFSASVTLKDGQTEINIGVKKAG